MAKPIIVSTKAAVTNQLVRNLLIAHESLSKTCDEDSVKSLIRLSKFLLLFSEKVADVIVNALPENDGNGSDNPPKKL